MAARQILVPGAMPSRDANGRSLPANLRFYVPGAAFSTPKTVYTTSALDVAHPFPLPSDSAGRFPQIWADEAEYFDVARSRLDNDAFIDSFEDIRPLSDALIASAQLAENQAGLAEASADAAAASAAAAEETADGIGDVLTTAAGYAAQALAYRNEAEDFRNEAEAIVGFDPTDYVSVGSAQSYSDAEKLQGRSNLGAAPLAAPAFTGAATFAGAVTFNAAAEAAAGLTVAGGASVAGGLSATGGLTLTGSTKYNVQAVPALELDLSAADFFTKSISANSTFTFANATASKGLAFVVFLTISNDAVPTWPASVENPITGLVNGLNVVGFISPDGGTTWVMFVGAKIEA